MLLGCCFAVICAIWTVCFVFDLCWFLVAFDEIGLFDCVVGLIVGL